MAHLCQYQVAVNPGMSLLCICSQSALLYFDGIQLLLAGHTSGNRSWTLTLLLTVQSHAILSIEQTIPQCPQLMAESAGLCCVPARTKLDSIGNHTSGHVQNMIFGCSDLECRTVITMSAGKCRLYPNMPSQTCMCHHNAPNKRCMTLAHECLHHSVWCNAMLVSPLLDADVSLQLTFLQFEVSMMQAG